MEASRFSLAHLGLSDAGPLALIEAAGQTGFRAVGLPLKSGALKPLRFEVVGNAALISSIKAACASTGVGIFDVEALVLGHEPHASDLRQFFETAAQIGASRVSCLGPETGRNFNRHFDGRDVERLVNICTIAAEFEIGVGVEFMKFRSIRKIDDAFAIVAAAAQPNLGIIVDALHLARSGGAPSQVKNVAPAVISHVQICDAAAKAPFNLVDEARSGRLLPGHGALPLRELLEAVPTGTPLAMEIPVRAHAHLPVLDRVRLGAAALHAF